MEPIIEFSTKMTTNPQQIPCKSPPPVSLSSTPSNDQPLESQENGMNNAENEIKPKAMEDYSSQSSLLYPRDAETALENLPLAKPTAPRVPTLIDDSRSVKFTLPSHSMSLIQTNTPLLINKSRDFFNFISEKSTNIMEKALMPPHLTMRKQAITKPMEKIDTKRISPTNIVETSTDPVQLFEEPKIPPTSDQNDLTTDNECLKAQIKQLEETKQQELSNSAQEIEERDRTVERLTNELRIALKNQESLKQDYNTAIKDREGMLMRYAVSEKQLIDCQKAKEASDRKLQELSRENETLTGKLKQSTSERSRLCGILDTKCRELLEAQKHVEKLKEEVEMREIKLKWTQTKLKSEVDMHTITQQNLDKAIHRLNEINDESSDLVVNFHAENDLQTKSVTSHIIGDDELCQIGWQSEAERLEKQRDALLNEVDTLKQRLGDLIKSHEALEASGRHFKTLAQQQSEEIEDLSRKIEDETLLRRQVAERDEILSEIRREVEELRLENKLLTEDMECCRGREAYSLEYTQKLTETNVRLQSEFSVLEARARELEREQGPLKEVIEKLRAKVKVLEDNLMTEKRRRMEECELLAKHVAEQTQRAQNLEQRLEDSKGEISVLRRKHTVSIKELTRELVQSRKIIERFEAEEKNSMSSGKSASNLTLNGDSTPNDVPEGGHSVNSSALVELSYNDLDKNSLIEKILKMQRINVRRAEKIDFLEEHTRALVVELQKKTKIIQNYILHENFDAMGSNERDKYKAELARHGGIMASVYNHRVSDDTLTLELSLEINQKLQSVLEDALLKNITLKDNIDTLGEEIARLTIQNQQLKKSIK